MTDPRLEDAFDECLTRLLAGESADDCTRAYPELAAELRPMLEAVRQAREASRVPHYVRRRSRARFLAAAADRRPLPARSRALAGLARRALTTAIAIVVGFMLGTVGLYYASADSLPGDSLYGLKRTFEDTRVQLAADPGQRLRLEQAYNERRETEVHTLLLERSTRPVVVNFGGPLAAHRTSHWVVADFTVQVTDGTQIVGDPRPGFYVDVLAESHDGILNGLRLTVEEVEVTGTLVQRGKNWVVGDAEFAVTPDTARTGSLTPGAFATVRIRTLNSGDRVATAITILPAPTAEPLPTTTALPPTTAILPTAMPTDTPEPAPPATAAPIQPTIGPTSDPEPEHTEEPEGGDDDRGGDSTGKGSSTGSESDDGGGDHSSSQSTDNGDDANSGDGAASDSSGSDGSGSGDDHSDSDDDGRSGQSGDD